MIRTTPINKTGELNLSEYAEFLKKLKQQIQHAQIRAISQVNRELVLLLENWTRDFPTAKTKRMGRKN